jgi:hypothetical protein
MDGAREPLLTFVLTAILMASVALCLGPTLGVFFAGVVLCILILPAVIANRDSLSRRLLLAACVTDAIALVWLVVTLAHEQITIVHWLLAYLLLIAIAVFEFGLSSALSRLRAPVRVSAAVTILLMLLWLSSPVWLLHHLQTPSLLPWMQGIIDVHPLFAMNSAAPLGVWTESPIAYRILNLNQDVYYKLPGVWRCIAFHAVIGGVLLLANRRR